MLAGVRWFVVWVAAFGWGALQGGQPQGDVAHRDVCMAGIGVGVSGISPVVPMGYAARCKRRRPGRFGVWQAHLGPGGSMRGCAINKGRHVGPFSLDPTPAMDMCVYAVTVCVCVFVRRQNGLVLRQGWGGKFGALVQGQWLASPID